LISLHRHFFTDLSNTREYCLAIEGKASDECHDRAAACRQRKKHMNPSDRAASPATTDTKPSRAPKRGQADRPTRITKKAKHTVPAKKPATPERGTKTAKILALLKRPGGASLDQLRKATGWQAHSVRGFLSGTLKKKMGLRVASNKLEGGHRTYRIISK
jgi:hypothetical protein